jgi:hypothetical protein
MKILFTIIARMNESNNGSKFRLIASRKSCRPNIQFKLTMELVVVAASLITR